MLKYDIDELAEEVGGMYALCVLAKRRIHQLVKGAVPVVEDTKGKEPYEIALEEIAQGKVRYASDPHAAVTAAAAE